jgi:hypothetical protein
MGMNLANFEMTGEQLLEPKLLFSCFWNTRWINNDSMENSAFDALDKDGNLNANGLGLMIWGNYLGTKMVQTSSTVHIRSFASTIANDQKIYVYLLNKSESSKMVKLLIPGYKVSSVLMAKELVGQGPDDVDPVWQKVEDLKDSGDVNLKGTSIMVIEYQLKLL